MNIVLYGEETYLVQQRLDQLLKEHHITKAGFSYVELNGLTCSTAQLLEELQTMPFIDDKKIVALYNANFLKAQNETTIDPESMINYLENSESSSIFVMIVEGNSLDSRKKIVKTAQKLCKVQCFKRLDTLGKQSYILSELKRREINVKKDAIETVMNLMPLDMQLIHMEFEKLSCFPDIIDKKVASQLLSPIIEEDVFKLQDALLRNDLNSALHLWRDYQILNKDAIFLIALLASSYRFSYQVKHLIDLGKQKDYIAQELHAHPYRVAMCMKALNHVEKAKLLKVLVQLATLDQRIKSGNVDKNLGFELFLINQQKVNL